MGWSSGLQMDLSLSQNKRFAQIMYWANQRCIRCFQILIAAELWAYIHLNKWAMNLEKLSKFSQDKLASKPADKYLQQITQNEMPHSLKRYMEYELFP